MNLSAQSLSKRYDAGSSCEAVRSASLDLEAGDFVSIVGRSGSGKSTFLAMLGTLTKPASGTLLLNGADIWALTEERRSIFRSREAGFIFQFPSLLPNLTTLDNVAVPAFLGNHSDTEAVYARAAGLLVRSGLGDRAGAYPASLSGGEQRRAVIARALINSPSLVLADEPTSDLDEDTEADIIDLLKELQASEAFSLVLVTHNLALANHAQRCYEMKQGLLVPYEPSRTVAEVNPRVRHFGAATVNVMPESPVPVLPSGQVLPGTYFWRNLRTFMVGTAAILASILLLDFGIAKYQEMQIRHRGALIAQMADMALSQLQADIQAVSDLGEGQYELQVYLLNVDNEKPIYVMAPDMHAYVQIGTVWQEVSLRPAESSESGVLKIEGKHIYRYLIDAQVKGFTQLLPNYMHVRFSESMLVSPSRIPKGDVFERKDNFYVYLKPYDVSDEVILKRLKFSGKPPVWIPMPPH